MWKRQFDELILENDRLTFEHFATERGMKKGMKQVIEEGIKKKSIEIAKEGLKMNLTIIQIAKLTGLSEEKILELKQELDTQ